MEMDWTGSETSRKEQGGCRPPRHEPKPSTRYIVRPGLAVQVRKDGGDWIEHITNKESTFNGYQNGESGRKVFKNGDWQMRVWTEDVIEHKPTMHPKKNGRKKWK